MKPDPFYPGASTRCHFLEFDDPELPRIRCDSVENCGQDRPATHEWIVWEGTAADKAEAPQSAEKADPRIDLEWMRIRYERDFDNR
jgi:hypothetical protein